MACKQQSKPKATTKPSTTAPPIRKCKQSEVASSKIGKGKQVAETSNRQPRVLRPALQSESDDAKKWYHSFVPYERHIYEVGINVLALEKIFLVIFVSNKGVKAGSFSRVSQACESEHSEGIICQLDAHG